MIVFCSQLWNANCIVLTIKPRWGGVSGKDAEENESNYSLWLKLGLYSAVAVATKMLK